MPEFEVTLKWVGKGRPPYYTETNYGFGVNPPIIFEAEDEEDARRQLRLPRTVTVEKVRRVS
jgi:hypothetical protein